MKVVTVKNRKQLRQFITFPETLYQKSENWVPPMHFDEINSLTDKNPAFDFCESEYYMVVDDDGKVLGRVAAIMNHNANQKWNEKIARFGWIDFVEDKEVLRLLMDAVTQWALERGATCLKGPLGFTDMDKEGLLVEGFENLAPITCIYNFPYYGPMLEELGFSKDVDWTQRVLEVPEEVPPMMQYVDLIQKRFKLKIFYPRNNKDLREKGLQTFHVLNDSFAPLYEFTKLTDKQINCYLDQYLPLVNKDFLCLILNENDDVVGFCMCIPFLAKAFQQAKGKLFPFGFIPILKSMRHNDTLEALMIGVLPEYQGKGVSVLIFKYMLENCKKYGIKKLLMNPQLENNTKVQMLFDDFVVHPYMRRRSYTKQL